MPKKQGASINGAQLAELIGKIGASSSWDPSKMQAARAQQLATQTQPDYSGKALPSFNDATPTMSTDNNTSVSGSVVSPTGMPDYTAQFNGGVPAMYSDMPVPSKGAIFINPALAGEYYRGLSASQLSLQNAAQTSKLSTQDFNQQMAKMQLQHQNELGTIAATRDADMMKNAQNLLASQGVTASTPDQIGAAVNQLYGAQVTRAVALGQTTAAAAQTEAQAKLNAVQSPGFQTAVTAGTVAQAAMPAVQAQAAAPSTGIGDTRSITIPGLGDYNTRGAMPAGTTSSSQQSFQGQPGMTTTTTERPQYSQPYGGFNSQIFPTQNDLDNFKNNSSRQPAVPSPAANPPAGPAVSPTGGVDYNTRLLQGVNTLMNQLQGNAAMSGNPNPAGQMPFSMNPLMQQMQNNVPQNNQSLSSPVSQQLNPQTLQDLSSWFNGGGVQ